MFQNVNQIKLVQTEPSDMFYDFLLKLIRLFWNMANCSQSLLRAYEQKKK